MSSNIPQFKKIPNSDSQCIQCDKKNTLIKKYLQLIDLLKKKTEKSSKSVSSHKQSIDAGTASHTALSNLHEDAKLNLAIILIKILNNRLLQCFNNIKHSKNAKLPLLIITNYYCKNHLQIVFKRLKQQRQPINKLLILEEIDQKFKKYLLQAMIKIINYKSKITISTTLNCLNSTMIHIKNNIKRKSPLSQIIIIQNFRLKQQNQILKINLVKIQRQLQDVIRRQYKQSQKKKQSLEMLAQQLAQKNDIINQLQSTIKHMEKNSSISTNVLDDELQTMKKQIDKLQRINGKFLFDLQKNKQKIHNLQEKIKFIQNNNEKLKQQLISIKTINLQLQQEKQNNYIYWKQLKNTLDLLLEKLKFIKYYEIKINNQNKKLYQFKKNISTNNTNQQQIKNINKYINQNTSNLLINQKSINNIQLQSKINSLTMFFKKNKFNQKQIPYQQLFTPKGEQIFTKRRIQPKSNGSIVCINQQEEMNQKRTMKKITKQNYNGKQYQDIILHNNDNALDSVMDLLDHTPNQQPRRLELKQNYTIKMLQMEVENNKLIQKISEIKNKNMHIRNMVYNLLKSLEINNNNCKNQTLGILEIIFEIFEYSEQEKLAIFEQKKKKFFGVFG